LVDKYFLVWNEIDKENRKKILEEIWQEGGKYIDPRSNLEGVEALVNHIEQIQNGRKGSKIFRTSNVNIHHQIGRFNWELRKEDHTKILDGIDIVYFNKNGTKIKKIIGFFGELETIKM